MKTYQPNVLNRPDTFFGVCEALGEDLRFNANILRVALAVPLIWYPTLMLAIYAGLGILVLATRLLFPNPVPVVAPLLAEASPAAEPEPAQAERVAEPTELAIAA